MKYIVRRKEIHEAVVEVKADNPEEAITLVADDAGRETYTEYHSTMDSDTWIVEDDEGEIVRG